MIAGTASASRYRAKNHQASTARRNDPVLPHTNRGATRVHPKMNSGSISQEGMR